ncbi:MAG: VanW family protein [Clostridia bacterium]|nr:VanW family protein [Clostridia bacterium]
MIPKVVLGNETANPSPPVETDLGSFSTNIIDKRENRQNNIRITCSKLNGIIIESGKTFSFCNTIGKSTAEEGYKEADIIVDGKTEQALGGGNCQVSTTVYNAVLACPRINCYRTS